MSFVTAVLHNKPLVAALCGQLMAQLFKALLYWIMNKEFSRERLFGDGGMPSGHSACTAALATACALVYGFDSAAFAISAIVALVVMHDASGVRLETGKQAVLITQLVDALKMPPSSQKLADNLKELVGHTPMQVLCGAVLGIIIGLVVAL